MGERLSRFRRFLPHIPSYSQDRRDKLVIMGAAGTLLVVSQAGCDSILDSKKDENSVPIENADMIRGFLLGINEEIMGPNGAEKRGIRVESSGSTSIINQLRLDKKGLSGTRSKIIVEYSKENPNEVLSIESSVNNFYLDPENPRDFISQVYGQERMKLSLQGEGENTVGTLVMQNTAQVDEGFQQTTTKYSTDPTDQDISIELPEDKDFISVQKTPGLITEMPNNEEIMVLSEYWIDIFTKRIRESFRSFVSTQTSS